MSPTEPRPPSDRLDSNGPLGNIDEAQSGVLLDQVCEGREVDNVGDGLAHASPEAEKRAMPRILAHLGPGDADTVYRCNRAVDEPDDLANAQLVRRSGQEITSFHAARLVT